MKKALLPAVAALLLFASSPCLRAYDFGLTLSQNADFSGSGNSDPGVESYSAMIVPRFSVLFGDAADLYISAGAAVNYENESWTFLPKILRTEFVWRSATGRSNTGNSAAENSTGFKIQAGRMPYVDPLDFVAEGLFDGAQVSFDTVSGTFSAGAWYTGLLYKKDANITITDADADSYYTAVAHDDFLNTYFASRRIVASVGWEHPSLADAVRIKAALTGQFDVNDTDNPYHSQYVSVKAALPVSSMVFELGGCVQTGQSGDEFNLGLAGEAGFSWIPPTPFHSRLSFNGLFTSGRTEDGSIDAFVPITTKEQGDIVKTKPSGVSVLRLDYLARLHHTFSAGISSAYFVRSDLGTYRGYPLTGADSNKGYFLGNEFVGRLIWSPVSDVRLNAGAGVFLPAMGDAAPGAGPKWRVELGMVLAVY